MRVVEELSQVRAELEKANADIAELKAAAVAAQEQATAELAAKDAKIAELEEAGKTFLHAAAEQEEAAAKEAARAHEAEEAAKAAQAAADAATSRAETAEAVLAAEPGAIAGRVAGTDPVEGTAGGARPATWADAVREVGYARARREFGDLYAEAFPKLAGKRA